MDRMTRGGDGSHWADCEETHWDCALDRKDKRIAELDKQVEELSDHLKECKSTVDIYRAELEGLRAAQENRYRLTKETPDNGGGERE